MEEPPIENPNPSESEAVTPPADGGAAAPVSAPVVEIQAATPVKTRKLGWLWWALLSILVLALIAFGSGYAGYLTAIEQRLAFEAAQVSGEASGQFQLAVEDISAKRYDAARQRLEYVLRLDPNFPQAQNLLTEVLVEMSITATPTPQPTPTLTPTPDFRGREEMYLQARAQLLNQEWSEAIETLLSLRKKDPAYLAVDVDGLLFVALRNRGVQKISRGDLEGGTYDLALAQGFGPLDSEARAWREWAAMYIRGASFWEVDWPQAINYFSQLVPLAPNLMDASGKTTTIRYYESLLKYGDWLSAREDWCLAQQQYEAAMAFRSSPEVQPTAEFVLQQCVSASAPPPPAETPTPDPNATPTPTDTVTPESGTAPDPEVTPTP